MIDNSIRFEMAQTLCLGATLLQQIGGDVNIGSVYPFDPLKLHVSANDQASLGLWAKALGLDIVEHPHEDTIQHWADGGMYGHEFHVVWIEKLYKPVDVTGWTDEEIQHQHDLDIEAGVSA